MGSGLGISSMGSSGRWIQQSSRHCSEQQRRLPHQPQGGRRGYHTPWISYLQYEASSIWTTHDAAVYSCLTTAFYSAGCLGEFTVLNIGAFNKEAHVKPSDIRVELDQNGLHSTVFHIPRTKTSIHGEDVSWSKQAGDTDLEVALTHHMALNKSLADAHLFSYLKDSKFCPLMKTKFI